MSARVESTAVREPSWRPVVIAIVAALGLGALAVGTVRFAFGDDAPTTATSVQAPLWDAQKLDAMEGRQLAELVATTGAVVPALEPGELKAVLEGREVVVQPILWDAGKLETMEGRQLSERYATRPGGWDAGKLEAMEGRQLAEQVGAEDPILVPHVPKRAPRE